MKQTLCCQDEPGYRVGEIRSTCFNGPPSIHETNLMRFLLEQRRYQNASILHVGIGASWMAAKFANRSGPFEGLTLNEEEKRLGSRHNYHSIHVHNKYEPDLPSIFDAKFDIILDAEILGYACCLPHARNVLHSYRNMLQPRGVIATTKDGASFDMELISMTCDDKLPDFQSNLVSLGQLAADYGLVIHKQTEDVFALQVQ